MNRQCPAGFRIALPLLLLSQLTTAHAADRHREMKQARQALTNAVNSLERAEGKFGGHKDKALALAKQALEQVNEGLKDDKGWF